MNKYKQERRELGVRMLKMRELLEKTPLSEFSAQYLASIITVMGTGQGYEISYSEQCSLGRLEKFFEDRERKLKDKEGARTSLIECKVVR